MVVGLLREEFKGKIRVINIGEGVILNRRRFKPWISVTFPGGEQEEPEEQATETAQEGYQSRGKQRRRGL